MRQNCRWRVNTSEAGPLLNRPAAESGLQGKRVQHGSVLGKLILPHLLMTPANPSVQVGVFCVLNAAIIYNALSV